MHEHKTISADVLESWPPVDEAPLNRLLQEEIAASPAKLVVLDDDPTGVQTVHGVPVYTGWTDEQVAEGFLEPGKLFYILTNSRGFTTEQTAGAHREIAKTIRKASRESGTPFLIMSRSDSTMRGHYPLETETLRGELEAEGGAGFDGEILCFFFKEGGRYTIDNVHYVRYGDSLVPAGESEFARDKAFGYASSDLRDYVEEKTGGAYKAGDVAAISLESLRTLDFDGIERKLLALSGFGKLIVNAVDYCDVKVFCVALYRAMAKGKRFLFRTAASLVKVAGGIGDRPLLTRQDLIDPGNQNGGVILVGSHVDKTTRQLDALRESGDALAFVEFDQHLVLVEGGLERETARVTALAERHIQSGETAVIYTRRDRLDLDGGDPDAQLAVSVRISDALTGVIGGLRARPSFIVAKGGITSSDVGTKALLVKRALIAGQILPGVPVWQTGEESKFPGLPYIIFPGNVGGDDALVAIVRGLRGG